MRELILSTRNSFLRFRAGLKVNLRQYIKSDFDLFWGPDVLWRSDFDVINRSSNFIRLLLNSPLESHWIRGLKLTSKLRAVQFWVSWKKWQQNQNVVRQFQAAQCGLVVSKEKRRINENIFLKLNRISWRRNLLHVIERRIKSLWDEIKLEWTSQSTNYHLHHQVRPHHHCYFVLLHFYKT